MEDKEKEVQQQIQHEIQQQAIREIKDLLGTKTNEIRLSEESTNEKVVKISVILDTVKFLNEFDKNIEILNKYKLNNRDLER